ncbi:MAG TPA: HD domain-containing phosphohydrolase [Dehalococcoidia bacterium]|nr:HD domain-containing phosphohydrolase [Dehalococcoidia bacterium]
MSAIGDAPTGDGIDCRTVDALTQAMAVWDAENLHHCQRTAAYAASLCAELGIEGEQAEEIRVGALLHDIGKMAVDLAVLRKPGGFDARERQDVQVHPASGAEILARRLPQAVVDCAEYHHEQPDGAGYPHGLRAGEIPVAALICRVADVLDSLTTAQPYRPAMSLERALAELCDGAGTRYDERVVVALFAQIERRTLPAAA